ncbi:MAG: hypothetical protein ACLTAI_08275 [Thomasclavelia sp.]
MATTISKSCWYVYTTYKLQHHDSEICLVNLISKADKEIIHSLLTVGIPAGTEKLIMRIGQLVYNGLDLIYEVNSYVAHNIAGND